MDTETPDATSLLKVFASKERIKIAALILDQPLPVEEIARGAGLSESDVTHHLRHLLTVGLAEATHSQGSTVYRFRQQPIFEALKAATAQAKGAEVDGNLDTYDQKVLATFLENGKLKAIPAQQKKRDVILRLLAEQFEPDRMYGEKEVNSTLSTFHPDVASLRRYLVDGGFLQRQIVRVVETKALMEGSPQVDHQITYWKPSGQGAAYRDDPMRRPPQSV
jgi:hypothetical protein